MSMEPIIRTRRVDNMKQPTATFSMFLLAVILLAACGSDATSVTTGDEPDDIEPDLPAEPLGGGGPLVTVDITITHPDTSDVTYTISCLGDTATVIGEVGISDFDACTQLGDDAVRIRLLDGAPSDQVCTEIYGGPDVATIVGTYDGVDGPAINTTIDRSNGCGIDEWDTLLSDVLPDALGVQ